MSEQKTPLHMHSHPAYGWLALVLAASIVFGVAGWYYLIYSQGLNDDMVQSVKDLTAKETEATVSSVSTITSIAAEAEVIEGDINAVPESDLGDVQLDNTILGIQ